jgi:hypothetical protein
VSAEEPEDPARLRAAFESLEGDAPKPVDAERIFDAVHGELDPEERRGIVDDLLANPDAAEVWRLAREMDPGPVARRAEAARHWKWLAAAAAVVLTVGIGWQLLGPARDREPIYRGVESRSIASALPPDRALPRAEPVLRWNGVPGARYRVRVLTSDLEVLETSSAESEAPEYRLSEETMRRIRAGSYILWQVEGRIPGDAVIVSPTFRVRVD